jgi:sarcosine oxidase
VEGALTHRVAIAGLGAMGSAALLQLARRGIRVIGFDRFNPPHGLGSSAGETRVTRLAIGEGDHLTPLVMRSHELWRQIEQETGGELLRQVGALIISSDRNVAETHVEGFFHKTVASAQRFNIPHEMLNADHIRARWPQLKVRDDEKGYFEPRAGFVRPEACIRAQLTLAEQLGAEVHVNEPVRQYELSKDGVAIVTDQGHHTADVLIISAGAWLPELIGSSHASRFQIYRQLQAWFEVDDVSPFLPEQFPVFIWELQNSTQGIYGFPALDGEHGIKIASEQFASATTPDRVNRDVAPEEIAALYQLAGPHISGLRPDCLKAKACLYTVAPDFGFVIDRHPKFERVIIASPCSGHGFKHSPAIGEALADLALGQPPRFDLSPFGLTRLTS